MGSFDAHELQALSWGLSLAIQGGVRDLSTHFYPENTKRVPGTVFFKHPVQEGKPVAYASRTLTASERNYSQIEKETLAIVFGCMKFRDYIYGKQINVITDHKPLEAIFRKPIYKNPKRLERMLCTLQGFNLQVVWQPGTELEIADQLSRAPI